jgi:hypothetical protein
VDGAVADVGSRGHSDPLCDGLFVEGCERFRHPGSPGDLPLEGIALSYVFQASDQRLAFNGDSIADLEAGKSGHELPGAALAHAKQSLDAVTV